MESWKTPGHHYMDGNIYLGHDTTYGSADAKLYFRDSYVYINSDADGHLDLHADTSIDLNGTLTVVGPATFTGITTFTSTFILPHSTVTEDTTVNVGHCIIGCDSSVTDITISIPSDMISAGTVLIVNDEGNNADSNNITIATVGTNKINGADTATISAAYGSVRLYCDGENWFTF